MKTPLLALVSALAVLVLPGCFQSETTIHLNKDGSGTLVEETKLSGQMLAMMDQMAAGFGGGGAAKEDPTAKMFSEDKAKERAASLGEGVTFEKSEAVTANGAKGARVTYKFKDVNTLKVTTSDGMKNASPMGGMPGAPAAKKGEPIRFQYADGKLVVKMPVDQAAKEAAEGDTEESPADAAEMPDMNSPEAAAMKEMFADMKMSLKLVVEPGIAETDASHKEGNTITLVEMEMGKLMENADEFKKLQKVDQKDPVAAMEALKNIKGVKFETKETINVTVK